MLIQASGTLQVQAPAQGLHDIGGDVARWLDGQRIATGLLTLFCAHTSASLLIQENAAAAARHDLERFFERIAPESPSLYTHDDEGADDMPAHLRSALTQTQLAIPVAHKQLALGPWQGLFLFEHRREPPQRQIHMHLIGE